MGGEEGNDPQPGTALLERRIEEQELQIGALQSKLHAAQDAVRELQKEKEDRYAKLKAEAYENCMELLHSFQRYVLASARCLDCHCMIIVQLIISLIPVYSFPRPQRTHRRAGAADEENRVS